jgi:hypothetical protein
MRQLEYATVLPAHSACRSRHALSTSTRRLCHAAPHFAFGLQEEALAAAERRRVELEGARQAAARLEAEKHDALVEVTTR